MDKYKELWKKLGLDISAHARMMEVFAASYQSAPTTGRPRLRSMDRIDSFLQNIHRERICELDNARTVGRKIVGFFSPYFPEEIALAAGAIPVGMPAGAKVGAGASQRFSSFLCPLAASFLAYETARLCPYLASADLLVSDTICTDKKFVLQHVASRIPTYLLDTPAMKSERAARRLADEYLAFLTELERLTQKEISVENLRGAIRSINRREEALRRLGKLRKAHPHLITGMDYLWIEQIACFEDLERFTEDVITICDELAARGDRGEEMDSISVRPRLVVSGSPLLLPNWKLYQLIETYGAVIVGEDCFTGTARLGAPTDDTGETVEELVQAIASNRAGIDYAGFAPHGEHVENLVALVREAQADGVVYHTLTGCLPFEFCLPRVRERMEKEKIPFLSIVTDYDVLDTDDLRIRTDTFIEMTR